ncbi:glycosyl transferase family 1 [Nitrospira sp.]|nr:glycosyl transferase family 1 [Nitrospira sp.]
MSGSISSLDPRVPSDCRLLYLVGHLSLGGLERQLFDLLRVMDRGRYKPAVVVWRYTPGDHYNEAIEALGVPVVPLGNGLSRLGKVRALRRLVSSVRPEVIHSYSFYTNIAAWWAARGTATIPMGSIQNTFWFERQHAGKLLGRLSGRWPSGQMYNSFAAEETARQSATLFRPRRIYVITNGVDLEKFSPRSHPQHGYVLAVGSLYSRKRWDRLIRAVALLASKGTHLEVRHVGSGPLLGELEAMVKRLHIEHAFRFLGVRHDIPALLGDASFLAHTAEVEGCPNVVLEAMACGRAVVATAAGDIPWLVDDGKTGFVVPRDDEVALSNRIATLLEDRDLCRRMGEAGRMKAEHTFGLDRFRSEHFVAYRAEGWQDNQYVGNG